MRGPRAVDARRGCSARGVWANRRTGAMAQRQLSLAPGGGQEPGNTQSSEPSPVPHCIPSQGRPAAQPHVPAGRHWSSPQRACGTEEQPAPAVRGAPRSRVCAAPPAEVCEERTRVGKQRRGPGRRTPGSSLALCPGLRGRLCRGSLPGSSRMPAHTCPAQRAGSPHRQADGPHGAVPTVRLLAICRGHAGRSATGRRAQCSRSPQSHRWP